MVKPLTLNDLIGPNSVDGEWIQMRIEAYVAEFNVQLSWPTLRAFILIRDNFTCRYCGSREKKMHVDHVRPASKGGQDVFDNLVACCIPCNSAKSNKDISLFLRQLWLKASSRLYSGGLSPPSNSPLKSELMRSG
jgi:hypothetical protein